MFTKQALVGFLLLWVLQAQAQERSLIDWQSAQQQTQEPDMAAWDLPAVEVAEEVSESLATLTEQELTSRVNEAAQYGNWPYLEHAADQFSAREQMEKAALLRAAAALQKGQPQAVSQYLAIVTNRDLEQQKQQILQQSQLTQAALNLELGKPGNAHSALEHAYVADGSLYKDQEFKRLARQLNWAGTPSQTVPVLRVGLLLPLSGQFSAVGKQLLQSAQMAVFEAKNAQIMLYPEDTGSTPAQARVAFEKLLRLGVDVAIGPLTKGSTEAVAPLARGARLPLLALTTDQNAAKPGIYTINHLPEQQVKSLLLAAVAQSRTAIAALIPNDAYGQHTQQALLKYAADMGITVSQIVPFDTDKNDLKAELDMLLNLAEARQNLKDELAYLESEYEILASAMSDVSLTRLKELRQGVTPSAAAEFSGLFMPVTAEQATLVASQLAFYDVDQQDIWLMGTSRWDAPELRQKRPSSLRHGVLSAHPTTRWNDYRSQFNNVYGAAPLPIAAVVYDAIHWLAEANTEQAYHRVPLVRSLTRLRGHAGVAGPIRIHEDGSAERWYPVQPLRYYSAPLVRAPVLPPVPLPNPLLPEFAPAPSSPRYYMPWWNN